jgi:hypothetical protein
VLLTHHITILTHNSTAFCPINPSLSPNKMCFPYPCVEISGSDTPQYTCDMLVACPLEDVLAEWSCKSAAWPGSWVDWSPSVGGSVTKRPKSHLLLATFCQVVWATRLQLLAEDSECAGPGVTGSHQMTFPHSFTIPAFHRFALLSFSPPVCFS